MAQEIEVRLPKFSAVFEIHLGGQTFRTTYDGEVPEEIMGYAEQVIGDGHARVAVSGDHKATDYGNGVGVSVTISLSCNQDDQTIPQVVRTLGGWTRFFAKELWQQADAEFQPMFEEWKAKKSAPLAKGHIPAGPPAFAPPMPGKK